MFEMERTDASSARDFVERELRTSPSLSYAELRDRAAAAGFDVPPFLYGSMRRQLGLGSVTTTAEAPRAAPAARAAEPTPADAGTNDADAVDAAPAEPDETAAAPARKESQTPFEFAREMLQLSPDISYQDLKLRGSMAGIKIPPIVFGRAKAVLGLVPTRPRQRRKPVLAPPPRSLQQVESAREFTPSRSPDVDGLLFVEQLVATVRKLEGERDRLRDALHEALELVRDALA